MPDDVMSRAILERLDAPLISTSVKVPARNEWMIDPVNTYGPEGLDFVVDGDIRIADTSTVVDMTRVYPKVVRQGKDPNCPGSKGPKLSACLDRKDPNCPGWKQRKMWMGAARKT